MGAPIKMPDGCFSSVDDLKAGDIVFFTMSPKPYSSLMSASNSFVRLFQSFVEGEGGHKNIEHCGLMVDVDEITPSGEKKTSLKMAHLLLTKYKVIDPQRYISHRTAIIYRPKNENERLALAEQLKNICHEKQDVFEKKMQFRWWIIVGSFIKRFVNALGFYNTQLEIKPKTPSKREHNILGPSICPKFIADTYIEAARRLAVAGDKRPFREHYMNIDSSTLLKSLQSYLNNNINYTCHVLPHQHNSYDMLYHEILTQRNRLNNMESSAAKIKAGMIDLALEAFAIDTNVDKNNEYAKSLHLLKTVMPSLRHNTGTGLGVPASYKAVIAVAKSQGIYPEFCESMVVKETEASLNRHLNHLGYDPDQRQIYLEYRRRGFTDKQAQFEAVPTLNQWCANHTRQLKAAACTGIGIFGLLAYGKVKTMVTERRNADYINAHQPPRP